MAPPVYDLYAVANHMGGPTGGHYTAYCKTGPGSWHYFNDAAVEAIDPMHIVSAAAYILFYKRREQVQACI